MADKSKSVAEYNRRLAEIKEKFQKNSNITEADIIELDSILRLMLQFVCLEKKGV